MVTGVEARAPRFRGAVMQMPTHLYVKVIFSFIETRNNNNTHPHRVALAISNYVCLEIISVFFYCPHESSELILVL